MRALLCVMLSFIAVSVIAAASGAHAQVRAEGEARALEQRLHAPCCREQMLESHESEPARALRTELRERFAAGESAASIEARLVERYGAAIVAIPVEGDPRGPVSWTLFVVVALSAAALVVAGRRWRNASAAAGAAAPADRKEDAAERAQWEQRLDAELERSPSDTTRR